MEEYRTQRKSTGLRTVAHDHEQTHKPPTQAFIFSCQLRIAPVAPAPAAPDLPSLHPYVIFSCVLQIKKHVPDL